MRDQTGSVYLFRKLNIQLVHFLARLHFSSHPIEQKGDFSVVRNEPFQFWDTTWNLKENLWLWSKRMYFLIFEKSLDLLKLPVDYFVPSG